MGTGAAPSAANQVVYMGYYTYSVTFGELNLLLMIQASGRPLRLGAWVLAVPGSRQNPILYIVCSIFFTIYGN